VLLFLKSVCSIEVLELQPGQEQPQLLFSCSVANRTPELQQQRAMFTAAVTAPAEQQVVGTYRLQLVLRWAGARLAQWAQWVVGYACSKGGSAGLAHMPAVGMLLCTPLFKAAVVVSRYLSAHTMLTC
jgi:hypothetical protein